MSMLCYDDRWWNLCQVIRELEFTFRVDICEVSYPHYIKGCKAPRPALYGLHPGLGGCYVIALLEFILFRMVVILEIG